MNRRETGEGGQYQQTFFFWCPVFCQQTQNVYGKYAVTSHKRGPQPGQRDLSVNRPSPLLPFPVPISFSLSKSILCQSFLSQRWTSQHLSLHKSGRNLFCFDPYLATCFKARAQYLFPDSCYHEQAALQLRLKRNLFFL